MGAKVGNQCKLYFNSATNASPTWVLIDEVGDVSIPDLGLDLAEIATRASNWRANLPGLFNSSLEFEYLYRANTTVFDALRAKFFARTPTQFAVMDGAIATIGSEGLKGYFLIDKFPIDQALVAAVKTQVHCAPAYFEESAVRIEPTWAVISA